MGGLHTSRQLRQTKENRVNTLTDKIQYSVDWNIHTTLYSDFYPHRVDKDETFPQWLQNNVKIEYFEPAVLIRTGAKYATQLEDVDEDGYVYWYWTLMDAAVEPLCEEPCQEDWNSLFGHLTNEDWKKRETDDNHY